MRVLEIGCGAGRVTRAFAGYFGEVYAVDISGEMVRQARAAVAGFPNAHVFRNNGKDLRAVATNWRQRFGLEPPVPIDFAFSFMVFQHIPSRTSSRTMCAKSTGCCVPGVCSNSRFRATPDVEADRERHLAGGAVLRREARGWRIGADSKCATNTAPATNITGSGSSRNRQILLRAEPNSESSGRRSLESPFPPLSELPAQWTPLIFPALGHILPLRSETSCAPPTPSLAAAPLGRFHGGRATAPASAAIPPRKR